MVLRWLGYTVLTAQRLDVAGTVFLEQQLQRIYVVKLNTGHTSNETVRHRFVLANVHVLYVVELCVRRVLDVEVILFWLIVVNLINTI